VNEGAKTGIFWGLALILVTFAFVVARPRSEQDTSVAKIVDKSLFEGFTDATTAAKLKIIKFNEEQGELSSFEIAKNSQTGAWTIPSAYGYPADATDQMRRAATSFVDTSVLDIVSTTPDEHAKFGVLEPSVEQREVGDEGVGTLVVIQDGEGNELVDLIVGNKVPDSQDECYVRKPTQDVVYRVKLKTDSLSTNFVDWIEKDLLQLSSVDIREVDLKDYAVLRTLQGAAIDLEFDASLKVDDAGKWDIKKFVTYDERNQPKEVKEPPQGKELDASKLNEMKNALDDLKIAGVRRKPEGLSSDLKANSNFMENKSALQSMYSRGFYPQPSKDGNAEVFAANGELLVTLREGVQYLLRFGEVEGVGKESTEEPKEKTEEDKKADEEADPAGLNRYLLVTARVNNEFFPLPDLRDVPQSIADLEKILAAESAESTDEKEKVGSDLDLNEPAKPESGSEKKPEASAEKPAAESSPEKPLEGKESAESDPKPEEGKTTEEKDAAKSDSAPAGDAEGKEPAADKKQEDEDTSSSSEDSVEASGSGSQSASGGGAEAQVDGDAEKKEDAPAKESGPKDSDSPKEAAAEKPAKEPEAKKQLTDEEKRERLEAEQEKITRENQRKLDERKEQVEKAEKKVRELNARFADWYYVVPESTYRKLRLKQDQLFKGVEPSTPSPGVGTTSP
jgi:hypothetical protein